MEYAVEAIDLKKTYKTSKKTALDSLTIKIGTGKVFGLLGPNGAGKSTLIKCLNGLIDPDEGVIKIFQESFSKTSNMVGYMPEEAYIYDFLTGWDFIEMIGLLRGLEKSVIIKRIKELEGVFSFPDLNNLVSSYSKGNKEKIIFLSAIIHSPKLLILDEPFTGFDPIVIHNAKKFIREYALKGNTVIFSTHILEMVAELCDEVAIIKGGKISCNYKVNNSDKESDNYEKLVNMYIKEVDGQGEIYDEI